MNARTIFSLTLGVVILAGSLLAPAGRAQAGECYGAFAIRNPSNVAIHYQIRWGDGDWKSVCVYPGHTYSHWIELDEFGQIPTPQIRFDWIGGDDDVSFRSYDLNVFATHYPSSGGKKYVFRFSSCGCFLDLYAQ